MRRFFWLLLACAAAAALIFLFLQDDATIAGLSREELAWVAARSVLVVVVAAAVIVQFRGRASHAIKAGLGWLGIALVLAGGYTYRFEARDIGERILAELVPGRAASRGRVVEIARSSRGGFAVVVQVNGARIPMVLDTGASSVVLTHEGAKAAGLPLEVLAYTVSVDTANGRARAAPVTLDSLAVGGIIERAVPALIAQPGQLRQNLLGMSFLNRLEGWEVRGDKLLLRGYP